MSAPASTSRIVCGRRPSNAADFADDVRDRVVAAALALLARDGREALTTRAVVAAAGIQAPTIYRLFGDKQGLVDAVAEHGFATYLRQKQADGPSADPAMLRERMRSLALAGRLRVNERRAADMVRAAACGVVFILLETAEIERDDGLSAATREAVIAAITTDAPQPDVGLAPVATTLRALLPEADGLSESERQLLAEWLDRLVRSAHGRG